MKSPARLLALAMLLSGVACRTYPPRPVVDRVVLESDDGVDTDAIVERLATAESPRLFGFIPRVLEYETYDPNVLARDLERIERAYRARGYYEAKVTAARVVHVSAERVRVEIRVYEGQPVRVRRRDTPGLGSVPLEAFEATRSAVKTIKLKPGDIFDEAAFESDRRNVENALRSKGFAFAKVANKARVDIALHAADVEYSVVPGPRAVFGQIKIEGLKEIPERPVREALLIKVGQEYSSDDVDDAEKALVNLGVFSQVDVREDVSRPESRTVPLTIQVEESPLRTVRLGGGMRFDVLRLSFHARTGWQDRNFLGGLRSLEIEARPGVTLFPTNLQFPIKAPTRGLGEFNLTTELRQPSFLEGRITGFLNAEYSLFPVLYPLPDDVDPHTEQILGYHEIRAATGMERPFFGHHFNVRPSYNWQANFPFYYQGEAPVDANGDKILLPIRVSFPEIFGSIDFRDDPISPRGGVYFSNTVQVAGYAFQGTVSDVKVRPELRTYIPKVFGRKTTLATRLAFGFLFPGDYGETLDASTPEGAAAVVAPQAPAVIRDQQKLLLRAFYSGGPNSNRGYPLRGVGPHGPIGFLIPANFNSVNCSQAINSAAEVYEQGACVRPLGGLTLWEASLEARFPISGAVEGSVFVDASDLRREELTLRLDTPHLSPGLGLRYVTPVGPLRLDLAYRLPYMQQVGEKELDPRYGSPTGKASENFLNSYWLPLSLYFAIGEAF